jgi:ankyrin repeat protein
MKASDILDKISECIYDQNFEALKVALNRWKDIDITQYNGAEHTLLHVAAKVENSAKIIEVFLKKGIGVNCLDSNGSTPLHEAVLYECPNNAQVFIDLGAEVDLPNASKTTPLITACASMEDNRACVELLLKHGALINHVTGNHLGSETALIAAIGLDEEHDMTLVKYLIEKGADVNLKGTLMEAISYENIEILRFLIKKGAEINRYININGENDLAFAKRVGNEEILAYLEEKT